MEQVQQELIRSNEMLATQVWVLGGLISFLLVVLVAMARSAWTDVREILNDHEVRLKPLEEHKHRAEERYVNNREIIEEISNKISLLYERDR